jgi:hypothetical protein
MNQFSMEPSKPKRDNNLQIKDISRFVETFEISVEARDDIMKDLYEGGTATPDILVVDELDSPGWLDTEVISKIQTLDLSQGGVMLVDRDYRRPENLQSAKSYTVYKFRTKDQLKILLTYLSQTDLQAESILSGYAKKQIMIFGSSIHGYPVTSNF